MRTINKWMNAALHEAHRAVACDEVPIGAVIVHNNVVIASSHNTVYTICDPTGHAEINVIRHAAQILGTTHLKHCDLYVTVEPCMMCAGAIAWSRIRRLYFGCYDVKGGAIVHGAKFFEQATCHHRPEIIGGIMESECRQLFQNYFINRRISQKE